MGEVTWPVDDDALLDEVAGVVTELVVQSSHPDDVEGLAEVELVTPVQLEAELECVAELT